MNLKQLANMIHENAVEHGWWESPRPDYEVIALAHSELSEALEEYRAGRPWVWYAEEDHKPEGIGIEVTDCIIRLLDWAAERDIFTDADTMEDCQESAQAYLDWRWKDAAVFRNVPETIWRMHRMLAHIETEEDFDIFLRGTTFSDKGNTLDKELKRSVLQIIGIADMMLTENGFGLGQLIVIKHAYNKTRPYRHGGKVC